jgi:hypothetical protein
MQEEKCQEQYVCDKRQRSDNNNNKDLTVEVQRMCNVKSKVVAAVNCGNWNILRIVRKVLAQHAGRARLQGTATMGTVHILRRVLT